MQGCQPCHVTIILEHFRCQYSLNFHIRSSCSSLAFAGTHSTPPTVPFHLFLRVDGTVGGALRGTERYAASLLFDNNLDTLVLDLPILSPISL